MGETTRSTALFLGAGASRPFGLPLTDEILPRAAARLDDGTLFAGAEDAEEAARHLAGMLDALLPGRHEPDVELPPVTDLLSLVDWSIRTGTRPVPDATGDDLLRFRTLLERAIYAVLARPDGRAHPAGSPVAARLRAAAADPARRLGIVTTNYDTAVEAQLAPHPAPDEARAFDLGFDWRAPADGALRPRPAGGALPLFKLHGSINWLRCPLCEHLYVDLAQPIGGLGFQDEARGRARCRCDGAPLRHLLVTPSLVRDVRDVNLLQTWQHALELLRTADEWIVVGYSLPPEDVAIRSLLVRAFHGRPSPPRVVVVQKGDDPAIRSRYRVLFRGCEYRPEGVEAVLAELLGGP